MNEIKCRITIHEDGSERHPGKRKTNNAVDGHH